MTALGAFVSHDFQKQSRLAKRAAAKPHPLALPDSVLQCVHANYDSTGAVVRCTEPIQFGVHGFLCMTHYKAQRPRPAFFAGVGEGLDYITASNLLKLETRELAKLSQARETAPKGMRTVLSRKLHHIFGSVDLVCAVKALPPASTLEEFDPTDAFFD